VIIIERVDQWESFQCLKAPWEAVYRCDPEAQYFLSWKWLAGVLDSYPGTWFVLVARAADGRYLGFLPLRYEMVWSKSRKMLRNQIEFAGRQFWADYGGVICLPEHEREVLQGLARHLKQMQWSHIYLKGFRISDWRYELFMEPFADDRLVVEPLTAVINEGETDNLVCPYLALPGTFETYLTDRLSSNTRQKIRRFLRKVESSPDYELTTSTSATESRDLQILEDLWRAMWLPLKGSKTEHLASMYRKIVKRSLDDESVHMPILWHRGAPVGILASFIDWDKSRLLFFVAGRDEGFGELPVGLVLHAYNIRWAIEHGIRTYDFLRGDEPYKHSLGATDTVRLKYPLIRTRSGTNLNGSLDRGCLGDALRMVNDFATKGQGEEATTALYQALSALTGRDTAAHLLDVLTQGDD